MIAVAQMTATSNKAENLAVSKNLIEEASSLGAKVLNAAHSSKLSITKHTKAIVRLCSCQKPVII